MRETRRNQEIPGKSLGNYEKVGERKRTHKRN